MKYTYATGLVLILALISTTIGMTTDKSPISPLSADSFLAKSHAEVVQALGIPSQISSGLHGNAEFYYDNSASRNTGPTFRLNGGVVVWVNPQAKVGFERQEKPQTGPYLSQDVAELVQKMGQPSGYSVGQISTQVEYPNGWRVNIADGMVVGVQAPK